MKMSTLGRIMLPHVTPEQVAAFFRATERAAAQTDGTLFPVYQPFPGRRLYCSIQIECISATNWKKGPRIPQVGGKGLPVKRPTGDFIVADADDIKILRYESSTKKAFVFIRDLEGDLSFLVTTFLPGMGPIIQARLESELAPLAEWIPY
jgi:hypothetical protein